MFAQLWATFCLVSIAVCSANGAEVVVYLSADSGQSPHVVDSMKRELGQLMQTAGYDVAWRDIHDEQRSNTASPLVVVHLAGVCSLPSGAAPPAPPEKPESLGATAMSDGHVLPFSSINCGGLTRLLAPVLMAEPSMRRDFLLGRAMARVLAHEFYHVLTSERGHATCGLAKPAFSATELVTERFEFEAATLVKLQSKKPVSVTSEATAGDDSSGRN